MTAGRQHGDGKPVNPRHPASSSASKSGKPHENKVILGDAAKLPTGTSLGSVTDMLEAYSQALGLDFVEIVPESISLTAVRLVGEEFSRHHTVIGISLDGSELVVACSDPANIQLIDDLRLTTSKNVTLVVARENEILRAISHHFDQTNDDLKTAVAAQPEVQAAQDDALDLDVHEKNEMLVVCTLLRIALSQGASDISLEPGEAYVTIRIKVGGIYVEKEPPYQFEHHARIVSQIKVLTQLKIDEKRVPQDGSFSVRLRGVRFDIRVNIVPTVNGQEMVSMRILDSRNASVQLSGIGMTDAMMNDFQQLLGGHAGVMLVTGPTGSGKTSTLVAALNALRDPAKKIITIEDPVEYRLPGTNQLQVNHLIGLSFANLLRAGLRMDPSIIMVGEIRDTETATIAMQAANSGHLVLSTLHTNNAISTISRLVSMGVPRYLVASSVKAVLAQRLVRRLCVKCCLKIDNPDTLLKSLGLSDVSAVADMREANGCSSCFGGYNGRIALHELLVVNDAVRRLVQESATDEAIRTSFAGNFTTLLADGIVKAKQQLTSPAEILSITST